MGNYVSYKNWVTHVKIVKALTYMATELLLDKCFGGGSKGDKGRIAAHQMLLADDFLGMAPSKVILQKQENRILLWSLIWTVKRQMYSTMTT